MTGDDEGIARMVREEGGEGGGKVVVALNKIDRLPKAQLLPLMEELRERAADCQPVPISARSGENVETLLEAICERLPEGPLYYPEGEMTTEPERAIVAEIVREKVMLETRQEVPYASNVTVDVFDEENREKLVRIHATIHVERKSQKGILIGRGGSRIKSIGQTARLDIERFLGAKVFLELFVRVQEGWRSNPARLEEFGL